MRRSRRTVGLSDTAIRSFKPRALRYGAADRDGLFVEVQPSRAKIWRYRYRLNGRREKVTIGPYPAIPIADQIKAGKVVTTGARSYTPNINSSVRRKSPARTKQEMRRRVAVLLAVVIYPWSTQRDGCAATSLIDQGLAATGFLASKSSDELRAHEILLPNLDAVMTQDVVSSRSMKEEIRQRSPQQ